MGPLVGKFLKDPLGSRDIGPLIAVDAIRRLQAVAKLPTFNNCVDFEFLVSHENRLCTVSDSRVVVVMNDETRFPIVIWEFPHTKGAEHEGRDRTPQDRARQA